MVIEDAFLLHCLLELVIVEILVGRGGLGLDAFEEVGNIREPLLFLPLLILHC